MPRSHSAARSHPGVPKSSERALPRGGPSVAAMTPDHVGEFTLQAMLCDSATAVEGKLYVHGGGWNAIAAGSVPLGVPRIGIALLLGVPYRESDTQHQLTVALEDEDGTRLPLGRTEQPGTIPVIEFGFGVGRPTLIAPGDPQLLPFALNIDGYVFGRPGGYVFVVAVDGVELTRLRFRLHLRPQSPTEQADT